MPHRMQFGPFTLLCGDYARPYFPGFHFHLLPRGNSLVIGGDKNYHLGNPSAHDLIRASQNMTLVKADLKPVLPMPFILIDSQSLSWPRSCKLVAKTYRKLTRLPHIDSVQLIFLVSGPQQMLYDTGFVHLEEQYGTNKLPTCFPFWPEMPMRLYADLFGIIHPDSSIQEIAAESDRLKQKSYQAIENNDFSAAHRLLYEAESWYDAANPRRPRE